MCMYQKPTQIEKYFIIPLLTVDLFRKRNLRYFFIVDDNDNNYETLKVQ